MRIVTSVLCFSIIWLQSVEAFATQECKEEGGHITPHYPPPDYQPSTPGVCQSPIFTTVTGKRTCQDTSKATLCKPASTGYRILEQQYTYSPGEKKCVSIFPDRRPIDPFNPSLWIDVPNCITCAIGSPECH